MQQATVSYAARKLSLQHPQSRSISPRQTPLTPDETRFLFDLLSKGRHYPTRHKTPDQILKAVSDKRELGTLMVAERLLHEQSRKIETPLADGKFQNLFTNAEKNIMAVMANFNRGVTTPLFLHSLYWALSNNGITVSSNISGANAPSDKIHRAIDIIGGYHHSLSNPKADRSHPLRTKVERAITRSLNVLGIDIIDMPVAKLSKIVESFMSIAAVRAPLIYNHLAVQIETAISDAVHPKERTPELIQ